MSDFSDFEDDDDDVPTAPFWMTTFSDMATLLMTFFVMIVAMSEIEVKKFKEAISSFPGRTAFLSHDAVLPPTRTQIVAGDPKTSAAEREAQFEAILQYVKDNNLEEKVKVNMTERGFHVTITDSVMFHSGQATLTFPSSRVLRNITGLLSKGVESVLVEGHTDNRPIQTNAYPTNWELSAARSASVVRFMLEQADAITPDRYAAVGYGEFRPLSSNATPAGRNQNRRVEILFSWETWQNETTPYQQLEMPRKP